MREASTEMKRFLFRSLYRHPQVSETTARGRRVVKELFSAYAQDPCELPQDYRDQDDRFRAISDYIAGMTDRFAIREHERLTGVRLF
jgi:dGTPase